RASDYGNDMTLNELNSTPKSAYDVYYSGWDARTSTAPQSSIGIHHPSTDEKAISYNDDPLTTVNSCISTGGVNTHWEVNNWEQGTTEPGSSGSGLWDPATHLLVGYLSGGQAACGNSLYDCYGKMSVGWGLGLSGWLDPSSTGVRYVAGKNPSGGGGPTVLQNGVPVTGVSASQGQWKHYKIAVPA
ncbi:MAG: hypothetical protein GY856_39830, partial [bacterium]|nr:hypothetical protein [bacterium]